MLSIIQTIPYGERFHAKRIEKVLYNRDLLLNAEWNKPKDREVNLHRHPAFFGRVKDVIEDCCGSCPRSVTPEEQEVAEEEARRYVSGRITFMKDDPGRQAIGSFNPITDTDWTEMAYVGDTELLCNSIVDCDLERVKDWFTVDGADPNCRDYTGRTPLQLAVISSTPEIVQYLVDSGARLVARMADGRTALHLAAALGKLEMVRILLFRSEANEAAEAEKEDARRKARTAAGQSQDQRMTGMGSSQESKSNEDESEEEDEEASDEDYEVTDGEEEGDVKSSTSGSYVKVSQKPQVDNAIPDDSEGDDPDVYDVNVLAWDTSASALHLAIINGHVDVVKELVETFGADVLLPIKLLNSYGNTPRAAILTLALALCLPLGLAKQMAITLLKLGASSAQADLNQHTAFEYFVNHDIRMLDVLVEQDRPSVQRVLNHLAISGSTWNPWASTPLVNAIEKGDVKAFLRLLGLGANTSIDYADWAKSIKLAFEQTSRPNQMDEKQFAQSFSQPLITAISNEQPSMANELLNRGADPNTLAPSGYRCIQDEYSRSYTRGQSTLDLVQEKMKNLRESHDSLTHGFSHHNSSVYHHAHQSQPTKPKPLESDDHYLGHFTEGTYQHWAAKRQLQREKASYESNLATYNKAKEEKSEWKGLKEKMEAVQALTEDMQDLEQELIKRGAKTLGELYPDVKIQEDYGRTTHHTFTPSAVKPKKFEISVGFQVPDLTAASKAAYIDIFEAAWRGDIDTIKKYTLGTWGSENKEESKEENREGSKESPLVVAVQDLAGSTPFSVAVFRGHLGTAGAILEIAQAQYAPKEPVQKRHAMDENEGDSDVDFESDGDVRVYGEIVDERFTIDNIGEVATQVKSQVHPQALLTWNTNISSFSEIPGLFKIADQYDANMKIYMDKITIGGNKMDRRIQSGVSSSSMFDVAVMNDDLDLLTWLLDLYSKVAKVEASDENVLQAFSSARDNSFQLATRLGRIRHLTELIKRTGAGIPFQELAETSGVEVKKQPRYYQGLVRTPLVHMFGRSSLVLFVLPQQDHSLRRPSSNLVVQLQHTLELLLQKRVMAYCLLLLHTYSLLESPLICMT